MKLLMATAILDKDVNLDGALSCVGEITVEITPIVQVVIINIGDERKKLINKSKKKLTFLPLF